jgi:hypothetical protein
VAYVSSLQRRAPQQTERFIADSKPVSRPASYRSHPFLEDAMELLIGFVTTVCISLLIFRP